ncbi:hypothetical protein B0H14DRAFT_2627383 [Mycena olivaceomarginata]|nr:hypothetical protein B0H14DRAFT_2627383 [Mycena olivaceomarginata]
MCTFISALRCIARLCSAHCTSACKFRCKVSATATPADTVPTPPELWAVEHGWWDRIITRAPKPVIPQVPIAIWLSICVVYDGSGKGELQNASSVLPMTQGSHWVLSMHTSENGTSALHHVPPQWRELHRHVAESECGCGVVDTSPIIHVVRKRGTQVIHDRFRAVMGERRKYTPSNVNSNESRKSRNTHCKVTGDDGRVTIN